MCSRPVGAAFQAATSGRWSKLRHFSVHARSSALADEIFIDDYQLLTHISTGSSTQVWEATDKGGGERRYAMKLMLPEALAESERRSVLKHEAKLAERFEHPNLV